MELLAEDSDFIIVKTDNPEETEEVGKFLGMHLGPGDIVSLIGELGSGKTCFTRGIACGLGIEESLPIVSPTFTLINEYPGKTPLFHFDLYRLDDSERVFDLGYREYFHGKGVAVIEWGEKVAHLLPDEYCLVLFFSEFDERREIKIKGQGKRFIDIIKSLSKFLKD
ncbi:MAG: tRNA (adenosine(37)-N6)-threonylcarbamoyltransferase complex ATPase subunit type 1 TsaE [Thermodesulfobacteriota bacterium]|jgi:tRNA threonylcarbamoyladenosine biosynthesis protein TsaE|nr:MAG: tRNA (adenosine(37)-N6)-threonylcarbamoyltransferase complex ATPase subunit type 1 TsaE [Thermodesulfobacteriota bacterium]